MLPTIFYKNLKNPLIWYLWFKRFNIPCTCWHENFSKCAMTKSALGCFGFKRGWNTSQLCGDYEINKPYYKDPYQTTCAIQWKVRELLHGSIIAKVLLYLKWCSFCSFINNTSYKSELAAYALLQHDELRTPAGSWYQTFIYLLDSERTFESPLLRYLVNTQKHLLIETPLLGVNLIKYQLAHLVLQFCSQILGRRR